MSMLVFRLVSVSGPVPSGARGSLAATFSAYLRWLFGRTQSWLSNCSRSVVNSPSYHVPLGILSLTMDAWFPSWRIATILPGLAHPLDTSELRGSR